MLVELGTSLHFILNTISNKTYSLLSGQDSQAIQACNCKDIQFKSVRYHNDRSPEHILGYAMLCPVYILKTHYHAG